MTGRPSGRCEGGQLAGCPATDSPGAREFK
jgi:hypothetical protein